MIALAIGAAGEAVSPVKVTSISPNGWITAVVGAIGILLGSGGVYGIFKGLALMVSEKNKRAQIDNDAAAVVRKEMLEISDRQQKRIDDLERAGLEERRKSAEDMAALRMDHAKEMAAIRLAHAEEMAALRDRHEKEMRALRDEIMGAQRDLIQSQQSSGRMASVGTPSKAVKRAVDSGLGEALDKAFSLPGTDGEV